MRPRLLGLVGGIVALTTLSVWALALLEAREGAPTDKGCGAIWNSSSNSAPQADVAQTGYASAVVKGWVIKSGERGCLVAAIDGGGKGPWTLFTARLSDLENAPDVWTVYSGNDWRQDSLRNDDPNASVLPDGTVALL